MAMFATYKWQRDKRKHMKTRNYIAGMISLIVMTLMSPSAICQQASNNSTTIINSNGTTRWRTSTGLTDFNIEMRGQIDVTDDDKDIKSISDDGYLEINKTVFGSKRTLMIESQGGGKMKKEYYENRTKMPWEPNGKAWMSEILPEIVRNTGIGAESRVNRIFKKGGVAAVLDEIKNIDSDHVKSLYANLLMKQPVQVKDYASIANTLAEEVDSDHYLSTFLQSNISKFMATKEATTALFNATKKLDSDHYKTVVIKDALDSSPASLENVKIIMQATSDIDSDHYITEVLTALLNQSNLTDPVIAEMIAATNTIESDHYKTVVLTKALDKKGLSNASYQKVIESVKDIESDHYITQVINHLLTNKLTDDQLKLVLDISKSIESAHYRSEVLRSLLSRQDVSEDQFSKLVEACSDMDSDHYIMTVLQQALTKPGLSDAKIVSIINATKAIDSDHYITEVLVRAAPAVKSGSSVLKDAYRAAAKSISSETYYGRAMRAVEN
jgi:SOS response regulatory protein OraA/RecX